LHSVQRYPSCSILEAENNGVVEVIRIELTAF